MEEILTRINRETGVCEKSGGCAEDGVIGAGAAGVGVPAGEDGVCICLDLG